MFKCPPKGEQINQLCCDRTRKYYATVKKMNNLDPLTRCHLYVLSNATLHRALFMDAGSSPW